MAERFATHRRVEFCETDAAGIIHFSALFCYMEQAEHAFLRSLGTSVMTPLEDGWHLSWPRVRAECDFLGKIQFEELLEIRLQIQRLGMKSATYRFEFISEAGKLVAKGSLVAVCCRVHPGRAEIESVPIPAELRARLATYLSE